MNLTLKPTRWEAFRARCAAVWLAIIDFADDVLDVVADTAAAVWRPIRENARKLIPSRAVRWTVLYVPPFTALLLFALKTFGYDDLFAYVFEVGTKSLPVLISIAITYGVATGLGWNLDNAYRKKLQDRLAEDWLGNGGAFAVLAGEMVSILILLYLILRAMDLLQVVKG